MDKKFQGYSDAYSIDFKKVSDLLKFVQENYHDKINYKKLQFEHLPEKISLVIANKEPKDIFSYYTKNGFIEKEHINLRSINDKK